jgi:hypothetical protein
LRELKKQVENAETVLHGSTKTIQEENKLK